MIAIFCNKKVIGFKVQNLELDHANVCVHMEIPEFLAAQVPQTNQKIAIPILVRVS